MDHEDNLPAIERRIALLDAELMRAKAQKERLEDRCAMLLGRFLLDQVRGKRGNVSSMAEMLALGVGGVRFGEWLSRDEDRELFDLPALATDEPHQPKDLVVNSASPDDSART